MKKWIIALICAAVIAAAVLATLKGLALLMLIPGITIVGIVLG